MAESAMEKEGNKEKIDAGIKVVDMSHRPNDELMSA
jgi:hypothetical protein